MAHKIVYLVLILILSFTLSTTTAQNGVRMDLTVNITADEPDANTADAICDTNLSKAGEQCSLRAAVETIRFNGSDGSVAIPAGTYFITDSDGLLSVNHITFTGAGQGKTIINISNAGNSIFSPQITFGLFDMTFVSNTPLPSGLFNTVISVDDAANTTIRRVTFTGVNRLIFDIDGQSSAHTILVEDVIIEKFSSPDLPVILFDAGISDLTNFTLRRVVLRDSAMRGTTNSLVMVEGGVLKIEHSRFENNRSDYRGVIQGINTSYLVIENSIFRNNVAFDGAAVFATRAGISDSLFQNNYATYRGGAVTLDGANIAPAGISRSAFINNTAGAYGGGLAIGNDQSPTILNVTFSGNIAGGFGGGIYINGKTGNAVTLKHLSIGENTATIRGGGVYNDNISDGLGSSTVTISNSAIFGNLVTDLFSQFEECDGTLVNGGGNWVPDSSGKCSFTPANNTVFDAPSLSYEGGYTPLYAFPVGSPLVGLVPSAQCDDIDQRDVDRVIGVNCTAGSYEPTSDIFTLTVKNASFDAPISNSNWKASGLSKDKRVCDNLVQKKFLSHSGTCAFVFQDKTGKLTQTLNPAEVSTLFNHYISGTLFVQNTAPNPGIVLTLKFTDASNVSETLTLDLTTQSSASAVYREFGFNTEEPLTITPVKGVITLQFKGTGKLYIDDLSIFAASGGSRGATPTLRDGATTLPLPQVPDGFRGNN